MLKLDKNYQLNLTELSFWSKLNIKKINTKIK